MKKHSGRVQRIKLYAHIFEPYKVVSESVWMKLQDLRVLKLFRGADEH